MTEKTRTDGNRIVIETERLDKLVERAQQAIAQDDKEVPVFWKNKYKKDAARNWDLFYKRNTTKFFKDRHWTDREFKELADQTREQKCLEVGCGVGNFVFPLLADNPSLFIYACDFSERAVNMVKSNENYDESRCKAFVCDLTADKLTDNIPVDSLDLVSAIFVFSAIPPEKMAIAIKNIYSVLKPGGQVIFRDYGLYDEAQIKFSAASDKKLDENFYVRHDGTMSYFFSLEDLKSRFEQEGFNTKECEYIYRETTNRSMEMRIDRIFAQAKFQKPQ
ncbi:methyltransferase-like protein 6-like protein [Gilbertella persicaria]|uniref:tRNA N(3)-methylcytidine methyltransferase n=1 Tax=Rhizopus stolonifer TaxID=4846 RepID=A0A367JMY9_RHIST|nr:methyltransferase-like protein 6-like protein [Gilbertella persicaria]KAI8080144.1 methyltransferase-like protein 6-like protein [Gilbertella persicaria]RCH91297.1 Methyltransferase-like protein 6 [Rhizopus stolonifer]